MATSDTPDAIAAREKYVAAWNKTMVDIWREKIHKLGVIDTQHLYNSLIAITADHDDRFHSIELQQSFPEYGLWQDLGVGRELPHANSGRVDSRDPAYRREHGLDKPRKRGPGWGGGYTSGQPRQPRRWFSIKHYASVMALRDFYAESLGDEFVGLFALLDSRRQKRTTAYYRSRGWA